MKGKWTVASFLFLLLIAFVGEAQERVSPIGNVPLNRIRPLPEIVKKGIPDGFTVNAWIQCENEKPVSLFNEDAVQTATGWLCTRVHEDEHIRHFSEHYKNICKGKEDGYTNMVFTKPEEIWTECMAIRKQLGCLLRNGALESYRKKVGYAKIMYACSFKDKDATLPAIREQAMWNAKNLR